MLKKKTALLPGLIGVLAFLFFNVQAQDSPAIKDIEAHRQKQDAEFRNKDKSPLPPGEIKKFNGLNYFPIDLQYRVTARFVKNETPVLFKMKTTTTRLPEYTTYGTVTFQLNGEQYKLEVYQSQDLLKNPEYKDYLFIPFTDVTNGDETYEVGRYVELRLPLSDEVVVDFNQCYNPYCSYGSGYSCPIPPEVNRLPIPIRAGEKKYKASH